MPDRPTTYPGHPSPELNAAAINALRDENVARIREIQEMRKDNHRVKEAYSALRDRMIELIGVDGVRGRVGTLEESRNKLGERIGHLERHESDWRVVKIVGVIALSVLIALAAEAAKRLLGGT
jgi:hypothetical protein